MLINTHRNTLERLHMDAAGQDRDEHGQASWALHGDCERPIWRHLVGRPDPLLSNPAFGYGPKWTLESPRSLSGWATYRCRVCRSCARARSRYWAHRAVRELAAADRTWFCTFTVKPEERVRLTYAAQLAASRSCVRWAELDREGRFRRIVKELGVETTLFLKRVRKNTGAVLRYILVAEMHKDGFPHLHALLHEWKENGEDPKATKRKVQSAWRLGFSQVKLCGHDPRAAWYVCKYVSKDASTRVRASQHYGPAGDSRATARLLGAATVLAAFDKDRKGKGL